MQQAAEIEKILSSQKDLLYKQQEIYNSKRQRDSLILTFQAISEQTMELSEVEWIAKKK
ncbi:hypothetical protein LVD15_26425 [Fulvivirga maritima]|uniref:hypothetical protein n=1 Tax=Fulvivirga maritima TaxID=2904247 RepID=UPI001F21E871|nr:hypothetical protein [Fulvivirga maritima]UII26788.1 hypothetical protein LVD15_26425 [Fulvivirga maritima]